MTDLDRALASLPELPPDGLSPFGGDWLVADVDRPARLYRRGSGTSAELVLCNGVVSRTWRLHPNGATVGLDHLAANTSLLRGVKPEATITVDGERYEVGGLLGQEEYGYLRREWLDDMTTDPAAFQLTGFDAGPIQSRLEWKRKPCSADLPWPPPGLHLALHYAPPPGVCQGLSVTVHCELYDGLPLFGKWLTLHNGGPRPVRLDSFVSERLAVVDYELAVDEQLSGEYPPLHVESDFAFHGMTPFAGARTVFWEPDPQYTSQVNYRLLSPLLLECRLPMGPDVDVAPGETFESFRTFLLLHDSAERERRGLALRRMYRTIAPWVTENPILMHARRADPEAVKLAVDQCADVGFEMVILTFGSGFDAENEDPAYRQQLRQLADYAHGKGVELGGYSLLASRAISEEDDVIDPETGERGHAVFANSPCLGSRWGREYFRKLRTLYEHTGMDLLEHDGSYPGDLCASQNHPGHRGLADSQWTQWKAIADFYHWCRGRGIYLNVPDWYFLSGSNKNGMGYREVNWSLPRERQILLGRQNIYDGTWQKTPSMGWMFVPLVEYHGGGEAATLEPLCEHLDAYEAHLAQNFGSGVQACYRGPRLYDTDETRATVAKWVSFYKRYRAILDSDIVHVRRPDARDLDCILHVNAKLAIKGLAIVYNPLDEVVERTVRLPLYYTGLTDVARIRQGEGAPTDHVLARDYCVDLPVSLPARGVIWFVIE